MSDKLKFTGGIRTDEFYATKPFAEVEISPNEFTITSLKKIYKFKEDDIVGFKERSSGVQIYHNIAKYPSFILFWHNPIEIMKAIKTVGFNPSGIGQMDDTEYKQQNLILIIGAIMLVPILLIGIFSILSK